MEDRNVLERILSGLEKPTGLALALLQDITENFSEERKIGQGGFGEVYKGVLQNGNVAVKKIVVNETTLNDQAFRREVDSLSCINHPNVVRFLGYCSETVHKRIQEKGSEEINWVVNIRERLICLEYISNGSLDKHITDELRGLEWDARHKILKGICEGLHYLHKEKEIIHMDLKPANILLDDAMVPKITDFGLSRPNENSHTAGQRFWTPGYCAPEYTNYGKRSTKSDIYSLGLVITELVTGRKDIPDNDSKKHNILRRWRHRWNNPPTPLQYRQVTKCMEISVKCREQLPEHRPHVWDIIGDLDKVESMEEHSGLIIPYLDDDMLGIEPLQLHFKQMVCELKLTNKTKNSFAFNIQTRSKQYSSRPDKGIVRSGQEYILKIKLQEQETAPQVTQNAEVFIVQSVKVREGLGANDISECMFREEAGKVIDEVVVYKPEKPQENVPAEKGINSTLQGQCTEQLDRRNFYPPENFSDSRPTNMRYLLHVSHRNMDITTGAMGSLLHKLGELLEEEFNLEMSVEKDVKYFSNELKMMHASLLQVSEVQRDSLDAPVKHWVNDARELSYDIEDVVDGFLVHIEPAANSGDLRELTHQMLNPLKKGTTHHQITDVIKDIKVQVKEVADRQDKSGVQRVIANNLATETAFDPRMLFLYKNQGDPIGIDGTRDKLIKSLTSKAEQLNIISICGVGGLGKTTLAKAVYDRIRMQFERTTFVSVGRNPDVKKLLRDILRGLAKEKYKEAETLGEQQLIDELRELIQNKRYFIVIDDLWSTSEWARISCAFMDNARGSRILTTTRNLKVGQTSGAVYKLEPLSSDNSEELLYRGLYGGKVKFPNDHPDELTKKILHKCGGVPLAIITIASLLRGKPRDEWSEVYTSIGFESGGENEDVGNTRKIILFSYYDLPCHLRTCLLHLSIFPEDYMIDKDVLIWKWVAEGIVRDEQGIGLFKVGERYFNDLISRSMIQVWGEPYNPRSYRIHDLVLDIIRSLSMDNNFVIVLDKNEQHTSRQNMARRIAVQNGVLEQDNHLAKTQMPQVRSFYAIACRISVMPSFSSFGALRVLDILDIGEYERSRISEGGRHHLEHIGKLLQLRYLGLSNIHISELPQEIGYLRFLQTLYLESHYIQELPHSVGLLRQLKCLHAQSSHHHLTVPDWIGNLTSLEELRLDEVESPNFPEELRKLEQLRVLCIRFPGPENESRSRALLESIANLKKIQRLELICDCSGFCGGDIWEGFKPPPALRVLNMALNCSELPTWINSTDIPHLTNLYVIVYSLKTRHVETLGRFQELLDLKLTYDGDDCPLVVISGDAFPELTCLETSIALRFEPGAMPKLEHLEFSVQVKSLHDAHFDFDFSSLGDLRMLGNIRVEICYHDAHYLHIMKAEASLRHTVRIHPNRPTLDFVRERMDDHLEWDEEDHDAFKSVFDSEQTDEEFLRGLMTDQKIHTDLPAKKKRKRRRRSRRRT